MSAFLLMHMFQIRVRSTCMLKNNEISHSFVKLMESVLMHKLVMNIQNIHLEAIQIDFIIRKRNARNHRISKSNRYWHFYKASHDKYKDVPTYLRITGTNFRTASKSTELLTVPLGFQYDIQYQYPLQVETTTSILTQYIAQYSLQMA